MKEADFQRQVVTLASLYNWRFFHPTVGFGRGHWATQMLASGPGFPDLVLVGDGVIFAELKSAEGRLSIAQEGWGLALQSAGAEYYIWRPDDLEQIAERLKRWKRS
jgi:hypothetical protein